MVRTDGPDGKLADYEIAYTFGVYPLQQYLIAFPGGRYQALPIAWDARPKDQGGQRWFHLQPGREGRPQGSAALDRPLPELGAAVRRVPFDQPEEGLRRRQRYLQDHLQRNQRRLRSLPRTGLQPCGLGREGQGAVCGSRATRAWRSCKSHWNEAWKFPSSDAKFAVRDRPADAAGMNTCAACHARRSTLSEDGKAGAPLEDSHRLALPMAPNYHADGQQREEVYVWGSFLQSKMHQNGVTCMDCHEPHSQKLRAEGNALCTRCHNAAEFDAPKHHKHLAGGKGAECVTCHMPTQDYMVIHARQDHSLRVPRPDLSASLGSPNACTQCHKDKQPAWAANAMDSWYGKAWRERPSYGPTLHAGTTQGASALPGLLDLARNPAAPAIIRATAATLAQPHANPGTLQAAREMLQDPDPSVRIAALGMVAPLDPVNRVLSASPLLSDPVRGVRIEAANTLADVPESQIPEGRRAARAAALQEYENSLALEADWPSGSVNLGNLRLRQGRGDEAVAAFERAIRLDPNFAGAYVNLSDALRQLGREAEGEKALRQGLGRHAARCRPASCTGPAADPQGRQAGGATRNWPRPPGWRRTMCATPTCTPLR